jgi:putative Holliday junction resolvase
MAAPARTFLGFDFGTKSLGIAVGSTGTGRAQPLTTGRVHHGIPDWPVVDRLVREWRPDALVVGLPLNMDDSENAMTRAARQFGHRLHARYNLPVQWVDERLTSVDAKNAMVEARVPWKLRKTRVDRLAAQTILQAYLDEIATPTKEARHARDE